MNSRGFTLLELIVVLFITGIIAGLGAAGITSALQTNAITTGADRIREALEDARTNAVTHNMAVEVRIYATTSGGSLVYKSLQPHWVKPDGTTPPAATLIVLSSWIALDATAGHSPLIAANTKAATPDATDRSLNAQTRVFHFLADGSTDLDPGTRWFVTVRPAGTVNSGALPSNWACVAVDATTGRAQVYRP